MQFQKFWSANLISSLSLVILQLTCGWAMVTMTSNALLVASVQMAITAPAFLFGLPFGMLADRRGKRQLLLAGQVWMLIPECALAVIVASGQLTPWLLVAGLALIGVGLVMHTASWKPLLCETFSGSQMVPALAMNSLASKIGKAVGPAMGGFLTGLPGMAVVLISRVLGHLAVVLSVARKHDRRDEETESSVLSRAETPSFRDGLRELRTSRQLYGPIIRCGVLTMPFAGLLALLPLDAKDNLQTEVFGYGGLLTALGIGTVSSMSLMPWLQRRFRKNQMVTTAFAVFGVSLVGISRWDSMLLDACFLLILGFTFGIVTISHEAAVQMASPASMRGLMTAFHEVAQQGAMVIGSAIFGLIAQCAVVSVSLLIGGLFAIASLVAFWRFPIPDDLELEAADSPPDGLRASGD